MTPKRLQVLGILVFIVLIGLGGYFFYRRSLISTGARLGQGGNQIAFLKIGGDSFSGDVYVLNVDDNTLTQLTMNNRVRQIEWTADGNHLNLYGERSNVNALDVATGEVTSGKRDVTTSAGKTTVFVKDKVIFLKDSSGKQQKLTNGDHPALSHDEKQVAFSGQFEGDVDPEIYVINIDGSGLRRVATKPGSDGFPLWSPDGSRLLFFTSTYEPTYGGITAQSLHIVDAAGQNLKLLGDIAQRSKPSWSPDGQHFAYHTGTVICIVQSDGTNQDCSLQAQSLPSWSPDGKSFAYTETQTRSVCIKEIGSNVRRCFENISRDGYFPGWRPQS